MPKNKKKPPSRIRFEAANPVVSARVPKEVKDRLSDILDKSGKSFSKWLIEVVNQQENHRRDIRAAYQQGFKEGIELIEEVHGPFPDIPDSI
jgi:predicted DNA-binding protein